MTIAAKTSRATGAAISEGGVQARPHLARIYDSFRARSTRRENAT
jgi:hypothetical protein